jgi:hypothetical protein
MLMENEVFLSHPIIIDNPTLHLSLSSREENLKKQNFMRAHFQEFATPDLG